MASRRKSRSYALQALYQSDLSGTTVQASITGLWAGVIEGPGIDDDGKPPESEEIEFAQRLANGVEEYRTELDGLIEACSTNWRLSRMPLVDRNILRMAAFELAHCSDIPATVAINEAVELAKRFGTADSRAFVNGIVDRIARNLNRLQGDVPKRKPEDE